MDMTTCDKALTALLAWNVQPSEALQEVRSGRVFKVKRADGNNLILKRVGERAHERLELQLDVLQHLACSGVPVAVPLKTTNGQQVVEVQETRFTLSPCLITDSDPEPGRWEDRILSYGQTFARLHVALASYPNVELARTTWSNDPLKECFEVCAPRLKRSLEVEQAARLSEVLDSVETEMRGALTGLPVQLIHRDLHDGNVLSSGDRVVGIVDCDHFSHGNPMMDIAYFLHHTIKWLKEPDGTMIRNEGGKQWWFSWMPNLIRAYAQARQVSERERLSLPYLMVWVMIMFANQYDKGGDRSETQLYLNLLEFVYHNRQEIGQVVLRA